MKFIKRLFIFLGIILILLVGAAIAVPIFFKDQIADLIKTEANKQLDAEIDFADLNLSLFRKFPNLTVGLEKPSVNGVGDFEGLSLFKANNASVSLDLWSAIMPSVPIKITSALVEQPEVRVMVLKNGAANYNIVKTTEEVSATTTDEPVNYSIALKNYRITNGFVQYEDHTSGLDLLLKNLNHEGSGNITNDLFDLTASTNVEGINFSYDNTNYLKEVELDWQTTLAIDQTASKYTIKENKLLVNALDIRIDGFVQMLEEGVDLNLKLGAPENEFKNLFSLIPDAYTENFDQVDSKGNFQLEAMADGTYLFDQSEYPAFDAKMNIKDGYVQYPDLPLAVSAINVDAKVNSPDSDFDNITVDAPTIKWTLGNNPFSASLNLKTPISDPDVQSSIVGKVDLADFQKAFPAYLEGDMRGVFDFDVAIGARMSTIEQGQYDRVNMAGEVKASSVNYPLDSYGYPAIQISSAAVKLSPQSAKLEQFSGKAGSSDIQAKGKIDNILAYFSPEKTMTGTLDVTSKFFNVDEWYNPEAEMDTEETFKDTTSISTVEKPFDRFDINTLVGIVTLQYDQYVLNNTFAEVNIKPNDIAIKNISTVIKGSDFKASGNITNVFDYLYDEGILGGDINVKSKFIDVNSIYNIEDTPPAADATNEPEEGIPYEVPLIPENIDMTINADVGQFKYATTSLRNINGALLLKDQAVVLDNVAAKGFGGDLNLSGSYDTKDPQNPFFNIKYDLQKLDFVESFNQLNTFQRLNPLAKFIEGKYSSSLILEGKLGPNLYPVYSSLNAKGFLETADALLKGFQPLEQLANTLKIDELKEAIRFQDTRNFFEMQDGYVGVAPFDVKVEDMTFNISGKHSITGELDYDVKAIIPREKLQSGALGNLVSGGLDFLNKQAKQLGLGSGDNQMVEVGMKVTGPSAKPGVKIDILGLIKGGESNTNSSSDSTSVTDQVTNEIEEQKEEVKETAEQAVDSAKQVVKDKVASTTDSLKQKAEEEAKKKAGEILGKQAESEVDSIKKALEKFNPFKKKKNKKNNQ